MPPQYHLTHACPYFLGTCLKVEDYYDDAEMPGSRLNIGFYYGNRGTSEQISIIPFKDGEDVKYFVVRGVSEGDRRVTRCEMIKVVGLGSVDRVPRRRLGGDMGCGAIQAEGCRDEHVINITTLHIFISHFRRAIVSK